MVKPDSIPVDEAARLKHNAEQLVAAALVHQKLNGVDQLTKRVRGAFSFQKLTLAGHFDPY